MIYSVNTHAKITGCRYTYWILYNIFSDVAGSVMMCLVPPGRIVRPADRQALDRRLCTSNVCVCVCVTNPFSLTLLFLASISFGQTYAHTWHCIMMYSLLHHLPTHSSAMSWPVPPFGLLLVASPSLSLMQSPAHAESYHLCSIPHIITCLLYDYTIVLFCFKHLNLLLYNL